MLSKLFDSIVFKNSISVILPKKASMLGFLAVPLFKMDMTSSFKSNP